jgi:ABC-type Mn2+/Zn2+ transport system ATPase subunit
MTAKPHDHAHGHDHAHDHDHAHGPIPASTPSARLAPVHPGAPPRLQLTDVTALRGHHPVVHHLTVTIPAGGFVAVVGPNGAGKTSLLETILGWLPLGTGTIAISGETGAKALRRVSYLPQRQKVDLDFPLTVGELVAMGRYHHLGPWRGFTAADHAAVATALSELGLDALARRPLAHLSGGQLQRAFLARALASGADVFLLDEPTAGLDAPTTEDLLTRLARWGAQGRLVLAVLHDLAAVAAHCDRVVLMNNHLIATGTPAEVFTPASLATAFGPGFAIHAHPVPE